MCASSTFANYESPSRRPQKHLFRFARNAKRMDVNDAKVTLDIIIRPSLQLWKLALARHAFPTFKRPQKTASLSDGTSSTSSVSLKKKVRFDDKPVTISRRSFFERCRKDSCLSPARPCLVIRENDDASPTSPEPPLETDCLSVYEDCLSDDPGFVIDLEIFEGNEHLDTREPKRIRRSEFYEMESGIAMFDQAGYASYCLSRWLEKQRKETRVPKKRVYEDPRLSWPSRTLSPAPPSSVQPDAARPLLPPAPVCRPLRRRSLPWRMCKYIEDELQNAIVVLVVGIFIHICLFLFLVYDILTRGLVPPDE